MFFSLLHCSSINLQKLDRIINFLRERECGKELQDVLWKVLDAHKVTAPPALKSPCKAGLLVQVSL